MGDEYTAKTFKSGNSVALRLPKALGVKEGIEMKLREDRHFRLRAGGASETQIRYRQGMGNRPRLGREAGCG